MSIELVEAYKRQNALPEEIYLQAIKNTNIMADSIEEFKLDYSKKYPKLYNDSEKALKEKTVVLIDDVTTTGSTAEVICERLKQAGVKNVYLLTVASLPPIDKY